MDLFVDEEGSSTDVDTFLELSKVMSDIDYAAGEVMLRHVPSVKVISLLSFAAAVIVFATTLQSWAWYVSLGASVGTALIAFLVLAIWHVYALFKEHPLLMRAYALRMVHGKSVHSSQDALQACIDVVERYVPPGQSRILLSRLDKALSRVRGHPAP